MTHTKTKFTDVCDLLLSGGSILFIGYISAQVENDLKPYWNHQDELYIEGECLMLGVHVVVPQKLQRKVLEDLPRDHPGMVRVKSLNGCIVDGVTWVKMLRL